MRSKILPVALIASLTLAGAAFAAATDVTGTIKKIDTKAMTVTLSNGTTYHLPAGFKIAGFKTGEKVTVTSEMKGALHEATGMKAS
jgi:Cu/Ag efflux protein CusF